MISIEIYIKVTPRAGINKLYSVAEAKRKGRIIIAINSIGMPNKIHIAKKNIRSNIKEPNISPVIL